MLFRSGKICFVPRIYLGVNGISGACFLRSIPPLTANAFEAQITAQFRVITAQPQQVYDSTSLFVTGPSRITMYAKPDVLTGSTTFGSFSYYEL